MLKTCTKCHKEYPATTEYFYKDSNSKDNLRCICKICDKIDWAKKSSIKQQEKQKLEQQRKADLKSRGVKICPKCKKEIPANLNYFYSNKSMEDGLSFWCKECSKENRERWTNENYDVIINKKRAYYKQIKDTPEFKARQKLWDKQRTERDRLGRNFSTLMCTALKGNKAEQHWETLVPYNLAQLRQHLESQFIPPMSWDNYGTYWEVDHIIPQNTFNFTKSTDHDFQICWSLANLRPLTVKENRSRPKDGRDISKELKQKILNQKLT